MSEIEPGLFLGNSWSSYYRTLLETNGINAVVSLTDADLGRLGLQRENTFQRPSQVASL